MWRSSNKWKGAVALSLLLLLGEVRVLQPRYLLACCVRVK